MRGAAGFEVTFDFDDRKFQEIQVPKEKVSYLMTNLQNLVNITKGIASQPTANTTACVGRLFECISLCLDDLSDTDFSLVARGLPICSQFLHAIPHSQRYSKLADRIITNMNGENRQLYENALKVLAMNRDFCSMLLAMEKLQGHIRERLENPDLKMLEAFQNETMFGEIMKNDGVRIIRELLTFITDASEENKVVSLKIIEFVFRLIRYGSHHNSRLFQDIGLTDVLGQITKILLLESNQSSLWDIYSHILGCEQDEDLQSRVVVMKQLFLASSSDEILPENEIGLLINIKKSICQNPLCIDPVVLSPSSFITERLITREDCLQVFLEILEICAASSSEVLMSSVRKMIDLTKPPINPEHKVSVFFKWLLRMIQNKNVSSAILNDELFLMEFFTENDNVSQLFSLEYFEPLFAAVISEARNPDLPDEIYRKLFDLGLERYLGNDFAFGLVRFLVRNLELEKMRSYFLANMNEKVPHWFKLGSVFRIIDVSSPKYMNCFLSVVREAVRLTNDHLFDDFVVSLSADSPIFKLPSDVVQEYVFDNGYPDGVLFIPSLLPLLDCPYDTDSCYNLYLMGRYSVPVFRKMNKQIPCLDKILNYFVRYEDYSDLLARELVDFSKIEKEPVGCYEFLPGAGPSWIELPPKSDSVFVAFWARLEGISDHPCEFLHFNGVSISIERDRLLLPNGKSRHMERNQWNLFIIRKGEYLNRTNLFMNNEKIYVHGNPMNFEYIGSKSERISVRFSVARNLVYLPTPAEEKFKHLFKPSLQKEMDLVVHSTVGSAPLYSLSMILADELWLFYNIDRLDTVKSEYMFQAVIKAIPVLNARTVEHYFRRLQESLIHFGNIEWIEVFINEIFEQSDMNVRTRIFVNFFYDIMLWDSLPQTSIERICKICERKLREVPMDYDALLMKEKFRFLLALLHFIKNINCIFPVIKAIGENCRVTDEIVPIAMIANIWKPNLPTAASEFDAIMLFNVGRSNDIQDILMQFLLYFEGRHKRALFSYDQLIQLAIGLSPEIGLSIFATVLSQTKPVECQTYLPILSMVAMRYACTAEIWTRVIRKAIGVDAFSIDSPDDFARLRSKVVFTQMICILFTMLMGMRKAESQFLTKCHRAVREIVASNPMVIFDETVFDYFLMLVKGSIEFPDSLSETFDAARMAPIQPYEAATFQARFQELNPEFVALVRAMFTDQQSEPDQYNNFVGRLVESLFVKIQAERRLAKRLISVIPTYASDAIASQCLESFYKQALISSLKDDVVEALVKCSFYCAANRPAVLTEGVLTVMCQFSERSPAAFVRFMLYVVDVMPTTIVDRFIRSLSRSFTNKDRLNLLQRLACLKVSETPVIEAFFQETKLAVSQESGDVARIVKDAKEYKEFSETGNAVLTDISKSDIPLNTNVDLCKEKTNVAEKMLVHLFYIAATNCVLCFYENQEFYFSLNKQLREKEKLFAMQFKKTTTFRSQTLTPAELKKQTKSYHISPFGIPASPRTMLLPSYFTMVTPTSPKPETVELRTTFFNLKPTLELSLEVTNEYPIDLYRCSSLFQCTSSALLKHFVEMFGEYERNGDCELVRLDLRVPCIYFIREKDIYLLTDASLKNDMISLRKITPFLAESVLLNEFGSYSLFCGHFVIIVRSKDIMLAHKYVSCTVMRSKMIYSVSGGAFVLENIRYETMAAHESFAHNVTEVTDKYHASQISTFDFLTIINLIGYRSFSDLSAYPIFPRLIADFYGESPFVSPKLRDLSVPVPVFADTDPEHHTFTNRMNLQGFHHAENVSNPVIVSSFNMRLFPFARYMWDVNNGWDHADRNFLSIPFHLTITSRTSYELIPELFCFPEILLNMNKLTLPDGSSFDVVLPGGVSSVYKFIELHRHVLESKEVNANLHSWIDLIFGYKQSSIEDLNCYSPMSYQGRNVMKGQKTWMMTCGQVPKQIFAEPCKPRAETEKPNTNIELHVMQKPYDTLKLATDFHVGIGQLLALKKTGSVIFANDLTIPLTTQIHTSVSSDSQYIAITFSVSVVMVVRVIYEKLTMPSEFRFQNRLICESPKFSVINSKQLICATVCARNVVIWSISTGLIITFVELEDVSSLIFDEPMSTMYIAQKNILYQFTLNGSLVRQITLDSDITCLSVCGHGFSVVDRAVITGHIDGTVQMSTVQLPDLEFTAIFKQKASHTPIEHVVGHQNSYKIQVYPMQIPQ